MLSVTIKLCTNKRNYIAEEYKTNKINITPDYTTKIPIPH